MRLGSLLLCYVFGALINSLACCLSHILALGLPWYNRNGWLDIESFYYYYTCLGKLGRWKGGEIRAHLSPSAISSQQRGHLYLQLEGNSQDSSWLHQTTTFFPQNLHSPTSTEKNWWRVGGILSWHNYSKTIFTNQVAIAILIISIVNLQSS